MKKTLYIIGSILLVLLVSFLVYYFLFPRESNTPTSGTEFPTGRPTTSFPDVGTDTSGGGFGTPGEGSGGVGSDIFGENSLAGFVPPTLRRLSEKPSAGAVSFATGSSTKTRFVERATGHVYEATLTDTLVTRISNTTIPKVIEALWLPDGSGFYARYLRGESDTIETYSARLNTLTKALTGTFLPANLESAVVGTNGQLVALQHSDALSSVVIYTPSGSKVRTAFTSPFSEWLPVWGGVNTLFIFPKPSAGISGDSQRITLSSGVVEPSVRGVAGLSLLPSPTGDRVIYSSSSANTTNLYSYDFKKRQALRIPLATIAQDKCVWSRTKVTIVYCAVPEQLSGILPDQWYRSEVSFNDTLWKIDTANSAVSVIGTLELNGESIDAQGLSVSSDDKTFSFINKKDLTPWMLTMQ